MADHQVTGRNPLALFTLKLHRGDGMLLLAMNWKRGTPPNDFVGFAIEYQEPNGDRFYALRNRLTFPKQDGSVNPNQLSTRLSPIQKFRWVHFPRNAHLDGEFTYRVTPVFMNEADELSYGEFQEARIELRRDTYPGKVNVAFTRGFVSSQAFVDRFASAGKIATLLPPNADAGLTFTPTHPKTADALAWMGFEAREVLLALLDEAIADTTARVRVIAYDLNEPEIVSRLEQLGSRLEIIIDDSGAHGDPHSSETLAASRLGASAGAFQVKRDRMGGLQHNKTIIVDGRRVRAVACGSTNFSWRGLYVQNNHAVVFRGPRPVAAFTAAFEVYWTNPGVAAFASTEAAQWADMGVQYANARVAFSPHNAQNALLEVVAADIREQTTSSLFFSLAFLHQTPGPVREAVAAMTANDQRFVYGMSDHPVEGIVVQKPDGNLAPVSPAALSSRVPEPFKSEPVGGAGVRMHHKFVVIDFDKPTARVYFGSYNFSKAADTKNGEQLVLVRNRRIAVSFVVEALRMVDHYHFRSLQTATTKARTRLMLKKPPRLPGEEAWWAEYWEQGRKIRDRTLFA